MKKSLSLVLALLLVLSALALPALAAQGEETAELPLVKDVAGSPVTIDGVMGADEGWAGTPYMLLDTVWTGSAEPTLAGEVYASYDTEYLYLFVHSLIETTVMRVLLSFDGKNEKTLGQWFCSCFYTNLSTNGRSAGMVPGSSQQLDVYCEFYTMYASGAPEHELWQKTGWFGSGVNGLEFFEMKIPLTEELQAGIEAGTVQLGVSLSDTYTASEGFDWDKANTPLSFEAREATSLPSVMDVTGATLTVDGVMGEDEGWRSLPYLLMEEYTDGTSPAAPSRVWISSDGKNLYFFISCQPTGSETLTVQLALNGDDPQSLDKDKYAAFEIDLTKSGAEALTAIRYGEGEYAAGDALFDGSEVCVAAGSEAIGVEIRVAYPDAVMEGLFEAPLNGAVGFFEKKAGSEEGLTPAEGYDASRALVPLALAQNLDLNMWIAFDKTQVNEEALEGLKVNIIGDSYFAGQTLPQEQVWPALLATKYNWVFTNFGSNGNLVSSYNNLDNQPMCKRYRMMPSNDADVIMVNGGRNDYNNNVPLGTVDSEDTNTFMGALNTLFAGLREKYPNAMLMYTTVWNFPDTNTGTTLTYLDYAQAAEQVCEKWGVYCFRAYDPEVSGVDMRDEAFRAEYCLHADDISHLNLDGMKLVMPVYEAFLAESWAEWDAREVETPSDTDTGEETGPAEQPTGTDSGTAPQEPEEGCQSAAGAPLFFVLLLAGAALVLFGRRARSAAQ